MEWLGLGRSLKVCVCVCVVDGEKKKDQLDLDTSNYWMEAVYGSIREQKYVPIAIIVK